MNREKRAQIAKETVAICEAGFYTTPSRARIEIAEALDGAKKGTILYSPQNLPFHALRKANRITKIDVRNETAFEALARLARSEGHIACLNFASAKNPGGGFLNGAIAQEEALASASGLYPCLLEASEFYEKNRANRSALYLDLAIFSPRVPFFRSDSGTLLEKPVMASVVTAPAPNAGAIAQNEPHNLCLVEKTFRDRAELVLNIASAHNVDRLVLGAWGCGVFRNDPRIVAGIFADLLQTPGKAAGSFEEVVFAVYDRSDNQNTLRAFEEKLGN